MTFTTVRPLRSRMDDFASGRLRGFCLANDATYVEQDFIDMRATGANVVRVPLHLGEAAPDLTRVRQVLAWGAAHEVRVIVVMCPLLDYWRDPAAQQAIVAAWVSVAREIKAAPALQAYDIVNEPVNGANYSLETKTHWLSIAQVIATALRAADARTPIMVEPCWWGLPSSFWQTLPVKVSGLVYSFHFYEPQAYTHQGVGGRPAGVPMPADSMAADMIEARRFADLHGVPMFVGEFSCVRRAPGAAQWVASAVEAFAAQGWGWTYHVWRGWEGWDAELGPAGARELDTPILRTLRLGME